MYVHGCGIVVLCAGRGCRASQLRDESSLSQGRLALIVDLLGTRAQGSRRHAASGGHPRETRGTSADVRKRAPPGANRVGCAKCVAMHFVIRVARCARSPTSACAPCCRGVLAGLTSEARPRPCREICFRHSFDSLRTLAIRRASWAVKRVQQVRFVASPELGILFVFGCSVRP